MFAGAVRLHRLFRIDNNFLVFIARAAMRSIATEAISEVIPRRFTTPDHFLGEGDLPEVE